MENQKVKNKNKLNKDSVALEGIEKGDINTFSVLFCLKI